MCIFGVVLIAITRMVSVGSILASILYPILTLVMGDVGAGPILVSILIGLLVMYNHRGNIERLRKGTENKLGEKI